MTREEAERACQRLAHEHPDRNTHSWLARQTDGGEWSIVKVRMPGANRDPLKGIVEAKPKPPESDDPRPAYFGNIPPFGA